MLRLSHEQDSRLSSATKLAALAWKVGGWPLQSKVLKAMDSGQFPAPTGESQLDGRPMWHTRDLLGYIRNHCATRYLLDAVEFLARKQEQPCTA